MFHQLDVVYSYEFLLYGISCHEKMYRLAWQMNKVIGSDFGLGNLVLIPQKSEATKHMTYRWEIDAEGSYFTLIQNRSAGGWVLPSHKHIDYLLKQECDDDLFVISMEKIRKLSLVLAIFELDPETTKGKENLLFD